MVSPVGDKFFVEATAGRLFLVCKACVIPHIWHQVLLPQNRFARCWLPHSVRRCHSSFLIQPHSVRLCHSSLLTLNQFSSFFKAKTASRTFAISSSGLSPFGYIGSPYTTLTLYLLRRFQLKSLGSFLSGGNISCPPLM